ncbi:MAG TPA: hypothetical protein VGW58_12300 [Pyrinomonadaceae bacterium]|nr:hypothetical protein [Pyrinomonadaceae bacterium]
MSRLYESEAEIEQVVRGFETCETPAADFHHREHLTVAVWYLQTLSPEQAVEKMRSALLKFIDRHGVDRKKYSEEVTVFWVDAIASQLDEIGSETSLVDKCNQIISRLNSTVRKPATPVATEE